MQSKAWEYGVSHIVLKSLPMELCSNNNHKKLAKRDFTLEHLTFWRELHAPDSYRSWCFSGLFVIKTLRVWRQVLRYCLPSGGAESEELRRWEGQWKGKYYLFKTKHNKQKKDLSRNFLVQFCSSQLAEISKLTQITLTGDVSVTISRHACLSTFFHTRSLHWFPLKTKL